LNQGLSADMAGLFFSMVKAVSVNSGLAFSCFLSRLDYEKDFGDKFPGNPADSEINIPVEPNKSKEATMPYHGKEDEQRTQFYTW
jgi:hypothetical protein